MGWFLCLECSVLCPHDDLLLTFQDTFCPDAPQPQPSIRGFFACQPFWPNHSPIYCPGLSGFYGHLGSSFCPPSDQEHKCRIYQDHPAQKNELQMFVDSFLRLRLLLCPLSFHWLIPLPGMLFLPLSIWHALRPVTRFSSLWHQLQYIPLQLCLLLYVHPPTRGLWLSECGSASLASDQEHLQAQASPLWPQRPEHGQEHRITMNDGYQCV